MKKKIIFVLFIFLCSGCAEKAPTFPIEQDHFFKYARQQLDEDMKKDYDTLYEGMMEMDDEIKIYAKDEDTVTDIYNAIEADHPEIFWIRDVNSNSLYMDFLGIFTLVRPHYEFTKEEVVTYQGQIDEKTKEIVAGISLDAADYDKVKYVYDYIIDETTYKLLSENNQNILSVLLNAKSVCAGYAKTMQYLLTQLEVDCHYLTGIVKENNGRHAWNMIVMDGEYYYTDVTSGDQEKEDNTNHKEYAYFSMTSSEMEQLYTIDSIYEPSNAIMNNYFVKTGKYIEAVDDQQILNLVQEALQGDMILQVKCSDENVYALFKGYMVDESQAFQYLSRLGFTYQNLMYSEDEKLNILNIIF